MWDDRLGLDDDEFNIDAIHSNEKRNCLDCGVEITQYNDSGWEAFTGEPHETQPLCKDCDAKRSEGGVKV